MVDAQGESASVQERTKQERLALSSAFAARCKFGVAWTYFRANRLWVSAQTVAAKYRAVAIVALLLLFGAANLFGVPRIQGLIGFTFYDKDAFAGLKAFCLAIGAALLGATAIASSFILFAMQVNVTRMPNGLFRRLSTDRRLLSTFALSFTISGVVAAASLVPWPEWDAIMIVGTIECGGTILGLYLYAYGRALKLVNPVEQLGIVVRDAARDLKKWGRRANRAYALLPEPEQRREPMPGEVVADARRTQFFRANDGWDRVARQAINYATSYARYFAEQGDHEVSSSALNALLRINAAYIATKGTTFFNNVLLMENPFVTDGIINTTLEALRQTMQIALARGDERQATQTLETMEALVRLYLQINYPGVGGGKTHAHLAVGYLSGTVESVVPHKMVDVLMRGVQLLGSSANAMIAAGAITESTSAIDKIGVLGAVGVVGDPCRPVFLTAIDQLSDVSFLLLRVRGQQLNFTFDRTLGSVVLLAKLILATPDVPLSSIHSSNLAPYFSSTSQTALRFKLTQLVNALNEENAVGVMPREILANLATWSGDLAKELKELLLLAIQNRSAFTFDLIAWITGMVEILIAASCCSRFPTTNRRRVQRALDFFGHLIRREDQRPVKVNISTGNTTPGMTEQPGDREF